MSHAPNLQLLWPDEVKEPVAAIRTYVNTRAAAYKLRIAGEIDKALVREARAEELFNIAQERINPDEQPELAELLATIQAHADNICDLGGGYDPADWKALLPDTRLGRRERERAQVERSLGAELVPSKHDGDVLLSKGYDPRTWADYILAQAEENGISVAKALAVWSALGPSEAFDGFISMLGDMADGLYGDE